MNEGLPNKVEPRKELLRRGNLHWVHWLVVTLSLVLTVCAWYISSDQVAQKNLEKFNRLANQTIKLVEERMHLYENALWGAVAFIDAQGSNVSYSQWLDYSNSLRIDKAYPGINGIGVIHNILPSQLEDYLEDVRKLRPDFKLHPKHTETEYWPITYIEPAAPNAKAIGLDMAFETNRYTSIKKARDKGTAQVTGPITLVQDAKRTPGFLFYTPFYKDGGIPGTTAERQSNILGVTYAPFIMSKLMQGTLATENRQVRINISDDGVLLYDDEEQDLTGKTDRDDDPLFNKKIDISMYGRTWSFDIVSSLSFRQASSNNQPYWILFGGLIIDVLLLSLFLFLTRANRTALAYADQMMLALQEKSKRLEDSNHDLEQFSYVASHDLKAPLNSIRQVVGWLEEDCSEILSDKSKEHLEILKSRSVRMMRLLKDLLDYSQINKTEYASEMVSLGKMSEDIHFLIGSDKNFTCHAPDIEINIPKNPLEIVLRNLISNAIKHHTGDTGTITVSYIREGLGHRILVEDDGPGIPENLQAKAMEMFQTLKPRDKVEGSGMGLAIVNRIVEHHGGTFSIRNIGEIGIRCSIFWPFEADHNSV
jgi:signal transduction histidine kinase